MWFLALLAQLVLVTICHAQSCPVVGALGCRCTSDVIDCQYAGLTDVPTFTAGSSFHKLQLDFNNITTIKSDAFGNLRNISEIYLENNRISTIHAYGFRGLEKSLLTIDLSHNNFTQLPSALGVLESLQNLDIEANPIPADQYDEDTLYHIGDTLNKFSFGSHVLKQWPVTIRHLQALETLNVDGGDIFTLPPDAFHGFEGTLIDLSIQNTNLIAIPLAISRLRFLQFLHFDHNHNIGDSGVLIPSFGTSSLLNKLIYISLIDDNLTIFPSLLKYLRTVETLVLDSNRLAFVSDASVQDVVGTAIRNISMKNCSLSRVPGAISKLTNLTSLDLGDNQIRSFENSDFDGMESLHHLTINRNPLEYIANETFKDLICLKTLNIMDSNIKTMPEAIRFLANLETLQVPSNTIECTCNIVWLKHFKDNCNSKLHIAGSCETINTDVEIYLNDFVPNCPNYNHGVHCFSATGKHCASP